MVLGAVVGLAAAVVHRGLFPAGLLLALGTTYAVAWWLRSRRVRLAASFTVGWVALLVVLLLGRPEGDFVLAADLPGYALLGGGLVLLVIGVVSLPGRRLGAT